MELSKQKGGIGHSVSAFTNATHGMTLAAVSLPYYRHVMPCGIKKFARFAENVWGVLPEGRDEEALAKEGLAAMEKWMRELGLVMKISDLGVKPEMLEGIADGIPIFSGGYKTLTREELLEILRESL